MNYKEIIQTSLPTIKEWMTKYQNEKKETQEIPEVIMVGNTAFSASAGDIINTPIPAIGILFPLLRVKYSMI